MTRAMGNITAALSALATLGCAGVFSTPCDPMLTEADLQPLVPGEILVYRAGYSDSSTCMVDYNPEGLFQTWAQVEASSLNGAAPIPARLPGELRDRAWLDIRTLSGEGWTAELAEAAVDEAAADRAAAELMGDVQEAIAGAQDSEQPRKLVSMADRLSALPPEQHAWIVVGPTWRAIFLLDKDLLSGAELDAFVKKTSARVP